MRFGRRWIAVIGALLLAASGVFAPDVQYTSSSSVTIHGAAGEAISFLSRLGGAPEVFEETVSLRGDVMRTDTEGSSTIIDLQAEHFITLRHERRTYSVLTFDEIRERLEQPWARASSNGPAESADDAAGSAEVQLDFSVDRTGARDRINGFPVERVLLTVAAEASATDDQGASQTIGSLVVANELWMSDAVEGYDEILAFRKRMAASLGEDAARARMGLVDLMKKAVENDPRIQQALERLETETAKLHGVPVRGTTEVLLVPPGVAFDAAGLFMEKPPEPKKKKRGLRALARGLADKMQADEPSEPEQKRLLTITSEITTIRQGPLDPSLFDVPADYESVKGY